MKLLITIFFLFNFVTITMGQEIPKNILPPYPTVLIKPSFPPQAKFLYNTDKGKVYALPLDNMPCLVPNELFVFNEHKNYKQFYPPNSIPNPYPKIEIIPKVPNEKISIYKNTPQITK